MGNPYTTCCRQELSTEQNHINSLISNSFATVNYQKESILPNQSANLSHHKIVVMKKNDTQNPKVNISNHNYQDIINDEDKVKDLDNKIDKISRRLMNLNSPISNHSRL